MNSVPARLKEALHFRFLRGVRGDGVTGTGRQAASEPGLRLIIAASAGSSKRPGGGSRTMGAELTNLALGLRDLTCGRTDEALARFKKSSGRGKARPLAGALAGLAHIGRIPREPGILAPMGAVAEAISSFGTESPETLDADTGLLLAYFRGVGLAIIPEVFETHPAAASDLAFVVNSGTEDGGEPDRWERIRHEIRLKAHYFLAQMHIEDERLEPAGDILVTMKQQGRNSYYGKWARKNLEEIGERAPACDD